jgi:pimeloyl-ACP methyl ester carboxylesterase
MSIFMADKAENLTVDGPSGVFTYRRFGPHGGVPLVLVNRFRGTIDWWDPEFIDLLAANHDVIVFDNLGIGHTTGVPRDSVEGLADGAIEFIEALGLTQVDVLGWSLGGIVAQHVTLRRPELVRKLIVAGSTPGSVVPGAEGLSEKVRNIMAKSDASEEDMIYLFFPETEEGRAAGHKHLANVAARLSSGIRNVSDEAGQGMLAAVGKTAATPFEQVRANLETIKQPVLYANGVKDVMIPALASYVAVQHLEDATLVLYSNAGHGFLFQHAKAFTDEVNRFLA